MIYGLLALVSIIVLFLCIAVDIFQLCLGVPKWRK